MNYLAHLLLAGKNDEEKLGGLLGDFTWGRLETLAADYSPRVIRGISIHRKIDHYTDNHSRVRESKARFSNTRRRFAGIIVDILYDHFLSRHWNRYSTIERSEFIADTYRLLEQNHHWLPEKLKQVSSVMIRWDWLGSYYQIEQIGIAYDRMSLRLKKPNSLAGSIDEVSNHYQALESDFLDFFPQLIAHTRGLNQSPDPDVPQ
ncbi:MAG: DUF479 domain-containing protein [Gammaproteobacteria bacterium]|nr:DUF479 domain-containing protein [Gammaproteobacteria bacterium]